MLTRKKFTQLAVVAALTVLFGANASTTPASAQAGVHFAQADAKTTTKVTTTKHKPQATTQKRQRTVTTRTTTRTVHRNNNAHNTRVVVRNNNSYNNRRVVVRSQPSSSVAFVVLGQRTAYASYGSGWCRALHNGRHWAPRVGWHRGRHVGAVHCS
jgi:hypothetical protein